VVEHCKAGRDHLHVVWGRVNPATMRTVHDGWNYRAHEEVARQLEREFDHQRVQGAHVERDNRPRPPRTPPTGEIQQAARTKLDPASITAEVTRLWQTADSGQAFAAALHAVGYVLARGDRRGFCIVDQAGGSHSLARRIEGAKTADVNARLKDIDLASLPSVEQARDQVRNSQPTTPDPGKIIAPPFASFGGASGGAMIPALAPSSRPLSGAGQGREGRGGIGSETLYSVGIRLARPEGAKPRASASGMEKAETGARRSGSKLCNSFGITLAHPGAGQPGGSTGGRGGSDFVKAASAVLGGLGRLFGGGGGRVPQGTGHAGKRNYRVIAQLASNHPNLRPPLDSTVRQGVMGGRMPTPTRTPPKRGQGGERPFSRLAAGIALDEWSTAWARKAKEKLIAYSNATGESVLTELAHLDAIITGAYLLLGLTLTGKQRPPQGPPV
jgi:hypothetical protein